MSDENKALIRRWFEEVWNKGREEAIDEMFAADGIAHGLADEAGNALLVRRNSSLSSESFAPPFPRSKLSWKTPLPKATKWRRVAQCAVSISQTVWASLRRGRPRSLLELRSSELKTAKLSRLGTTSIS